MNMTLPVTLCGSLSLHPSPLGRAMHEAGYAALGLPFTYVPFAVTDVEGALRGMRALGIRGFGVSMPYKLDVMPLLDAIEPTAARIGAVNTIVNDGGRLTGHNTDAYGAVRALSEAMEVAGKRVVVVGAGGAARAVGFGLVEARARLHVVNRTREKGEALAHALGATSGGLEDLGDPSAFDALVNASSAGMAEYGAESPVPERTLRPGLVVMDIVYKPIRTRLLAEAERRGATTVHGGRMLLWQACRQFELYTGVAAPEHAMNAALLSAIA